MIWIGFITTASIFNSVMDSVENEHINATDFAKLNPAWWNKRVSWNKAKKIFKWKYDSWHVGKSLMLFFIMLAIVTYRPVIQISVVLLNQDFYYVDFMIASSAWIFPFNLFYNKIFRK